MTQIRKATSCLLALIVSTMYMNNVVAGSLLNDDKIRNAQQRSKDAERHGEHDDKVTDSAAGPRTPAVRIVQVRPRISQDAAQGTVFIEVDQSTVCNTSVYSIDMSRGGSKEAYATALAALIVDKPIVIELVSSGCTGAGTKIQSILLNR